MNELIDVVQRQIDLIRTTSMSHREKDGALRLVSAMIEEVRLKHDDEIYCLTREIYESQDNILMALRDLQKTPISHANHNQAILSARQDVSARISRIIAGTRKVSRESEDVPF